MNEKRKKLIFFGVLAIIAIVASVLTAIYCCNEGFQVTSPYVFTKQLNAMPENCNPWYGCSWNKVPCKSNQDCESFRRCNEGKCIVPDNLNVGL